MQLAVLDVLDVAALGGAAPHALHAAVSLPAHPLTAAAQQAAAVHGQLGVQTAAAPTAQASQDAAARHAPPTRLAAAHAAAPRAGPTWAAWREVPRRGWWGLSVVVRGVELGVGGAPQGVEVVGALPWAAARASPAVGAGDAPTWL